MDPFLTISCTCQQPNILILGEGNFSFAKELAAVSSNDVYIFATSFDCKEKIYKDIHACENVEYLHNSTNSTVLHGIDATILESHFPCQRFCKVIFNYPHVGGKSNIKECRKLLYGFFDNASKQLCQGGDIVVSLCKGQGGTPADQPRRLYKNSWMVASQAAEAGLILTKCIPCELLDVQYSQAGYRGQLKRSFLITGGLVHILKLEPSSENRFCSHNCKESPLYYKNFVIYIPYIPGPSTKFVWKFLSIFKQQECFSAYSIMKMVRNHIIFISEDSWLKKQDTIKATLHQNTILNTFVQLIQKIFTEKFNGMFLDCFQHNKTDNNNFLLDNAFELKTDLGVHYYITYLTAGTERKILPYSNHYGHHITLVKYLTPDMKPQNTMLRVVEGLQECLPFVHLESVTCSCKSPYNSYCSCLFGKQPICHIPSLKNTNEDNHDITTPELLQQIPEYNADEIPNFTCDISDVFWKFQTPDICVSTANKNNSDIVYRKFHYEEYTLSNVEEQYFGKNIFPIYSSSASDSVYSNYTACDEPVERRTVKLTADGTYIANVTVVDQKMLFTIHSNEFLFACYGLPDIRYIWSYDDLFQKHIISIFEEDSKVGIFGRSEVQWNVHIPYILCYRHDLCFWLDETHTEEHLFQAIRLVCSDLIYGVRLIKVLRHEESSCVSYCYRMIYSSVVGPLAHEDTVKKQNELRLYLMEKGFKLR